MKLIDNKSRTNKIIELGKVSPTICRRLVKMDLIIFFLLKKLINNNNNNSKELHYQLFLVESLILLDLINLSISRFGFGHISRVFFHIYQSIVKKLLTAAN